MGGGGKSGAESKAATTQSRLAAELFRQSTPLREELFGVPAGFTPNPPVPAGTGSGLLGEILQPIPVEPLPPVQTLPTARETAEQQFKVAETNIMRSTPRGGLQQRLLGDINIARAQEVTRQAVGQKEAIRQQEIAEIARREEAEQTRAGRIFQAATPALGQTQLAIGGLGQAGTTQAALAASQQQAQLGLIGQLGTGVGTTIGLKGLGKGASSAAGAGGAAATGAGIGAGIVCWLALALYGPGRDFEKVAYRVNFGTSWRSKLARFVYRLMRPIFEGLRREE